MKRLVNTTVPQYIILIDVEIPDTDISATEEFTVDLKDRPNIRSEYQITEEQKAAYRDMIHNIMQLFVRSGFEIIKHYQSKKSYSYYIRVKPEFYEGVEQFAEPIEVKFRISDHALAADDEEKKDAPIIYTIFINNVDCDSRKEVIQNLRNICRDLKCGDYSSVMIRQ